MKKIFDSLTTREIAWALWLLVTFIACMFGKGIRQSIFSVFKCLLEWKILVPILFFFGHTSLYVLILLKLGLWDISLLKDTLVWALSFGFVSLINISKVNDAKYFKNILLDALKWTIAIEFIMNFFTFSQTKEIILVPVIVFSAVMQAATSFEEKHKQVEKIFKNLLISFSIFVFLFSLYKTFEKYNDLFTIDNFKSFLLPIFLTITFLPFMYLFNLMVKYETLWLTLRFNIKNVNERKRVKRHILLVANFNIDKIVSISENIAKPINIYNDLSYEMIKRVSKGKYIGFDEKSSE
jgi:hypothetical protein